MKTLNSPLKFMVFAVFKAVRHPRMPIAYYVCKCGCQFSASDPICPKCGEEVKD